MSRIVTVSENLAGRQRLICDLQRGLSDFRLNLNGRGLVACSGGKDSTTLLLLLRDLGLDVTPAIVDLGYSGFNAAQIANTLAHWDFRPQILSPSPGRALNGASDRRVNQISANLSFLRDPGTQTPCGACSQTKRLILLNFATQIGCSWIALGHHRDDFLTTILKDYFGELYYRNHGAYEAGRFGSFLAEQSIDIFALADMVHRQTASTMGIHLSLASGISLVRPMVYVREADIRGFVSDHNVPIFGSGCSHDVFLNSTAPQTKRELVHAELTRRLRLDPDIGRRLLATALLSLDSNGRPRFNPRATRSARCPGFAD